ncbi:hypothetical protein BH11CYA1_BH11CYA1_23380 [soil metagenome]
MLDRLGCSACVQHHEQHEGCNETSGQAEQAPTQQPLTRVDVRLAEDEHAESGAESHGGGGQRGDEETESTVDINQEHAEYEGGDKGE